LRNCAARRRSRREARGVDVEALIAGGVRTIASLGPTVTALESIEVERAQIDRAVARGHFRPEEEEHLRRWFARYLTARAGLIDLIGDVRPMVGRVRGRRGASGAVDSDAQLRCFVLAFTAACLLVKTGRFLVADFAVHKLVQRKLNEAVPRYRIPSRQYTRVYRSLTSPANAWRLSQAAEMAEACRGSIAELARDPEMAPVVATLAGVEDAIAVGLRRYVRARLRYRWHSWRRRRASAAQRGVFHVAETFGRVIAEARPPWHRQRVNGAVRDALAPLLRPGDVIVTRHDRAMSNLFLPGYWPHAALYIGSPESRGTLGVRVDADLAERWVHPLHVLEARKDGVLLRAIDDTLAVDAFTVIRPRLSATDIARAIANALEHEGKLYNFDFDFFTDERLVCTEVVYRAYEGVGGIAFALVSRGGRPTLSAEGILDMAVLDRGFETVAVYGTPKTGNRLVVGPEAARALAESYGEYGEGPPTPKPTND